MGPSPHMVRLCPSGSVSLIQVQCPPSNHSGHELKAIRIAAASTSQALTPSSPAPVLKGAEGRETVIENQCALGFVFPLVFFAFLGFFSGIVISICPPTTCQMGVQFKYPKTPGHMHMTLPI